MTGRRLLLVSSPGAGPQLHWSHAFAAAMAQAGSARGAVVEWLAVVPAGQSLPAASVPALLQVLPAGRTRPPAKVVAGMRHLAVELALARALRVDPAWSVVHVGLGARGSPNVAWLAGRLGARVFAVARGAEVVCQRGDLVDHTGQSCREFRDPERCRRCCTRSWWSRPAADDFRNRGDLLVASLQACTAVLVPDAADAQRLADFGLAPRACEVLAEPAAVLARVLA